MTKKADPPSGDDEEITLTKGQLKAALLKRDAEATRTPEERKLREIVGDVIEEKLDEFLEDVKTGVRGGQSVADDDDDDDDADDKQGVLKSLFGG